MAIPDQLVTALVRQIREAASRGEPWPSDRALAAALNRDENMVRRLIEAAVLRRLIRMERIPCGAMPIRVASALDGSWRTAAARATPHSYDPGRGQSREAAPTRLCLSCREPFRPRHRHNFRCCGEGHAHGRPA